MSLSPEVSEIPAPSLSMPAAPVAPVAPAVPATPAAPQRATTDPRTDLNAPISPPKTKKRRRAVTEVERKDLRLHNASGPNNNLPRKILQDWFFQKYHHWLAESTISESLSNKFKRLDTGSLRPDAKKQRAAEWPDMEQALFEWQQRQMKKEVTITGDILKGIAKTFFNKLPQY